jgi:3'(2'), 5'-bisphosphate nucleotidase
MLDSPEARFALEVVREVSLLARRIQREMVTPALTKDDRSPVTVADFAVQAVVAHRLADAFPGATLIAEEHASALRDAESAAALDQITRFVRASLPSATPQDVCDWIDRGGQSTSDTFWTLDPIDGTKGFLRHQQYAVAIALVQNGRVELGVLGCPELADGSRDAPGGEGSLVIAALNQGTWAQPLAGGSSPRRLQVSNRVIPKSARLLRSVEKAHTNTDEIGQLATQLGVDAAPICMDSQAKYSVLAAGKGDVLLRLLSPSKPDYREKIWDQAAGAIVIGEAGGHVTDLDGKALNFSHGRTLAANRGILATNGLLHETFLAGLREIGA